MIGLLSGLLHNQLTLYAAAGAFGLIILLFAFADDNGGKITRRAGRLRNRLHAVASGVDLKLRREYGQDRTLDRIVQRIMPQPDLLRQRLRRSGHSIGLGSYGLACFLLALAGGAVVVVLGFSFLVAVPVGVLVGLWLPHLAIGFLANRRKKKFTLLLPEAIGLMVRSVRSGLPITESFQIIGREIPDPVGAEFRQLCDQIRIGQPIDQALWDMARRVNVPEVKFLVVTLAVQRETGGNLAETLDNLDSILRRRRQMRLKVKALSSEARASAMIIGALPFLMMALLAVVDNAYLAILFTHHLGHLLLMAGATSMTLGVGVMTKMVKFDI
jgi:tight adherence protein B